MTSTYRKLEFYCDVIPAKAGIQLVKLFLGTRFKSWIPAFAGMTGTRHGVFTGVTTKTVVLLFGVFFFFFSSLHSETNFGLAGDYLRYGAGARALAMGGAFTGVADDASAEYWNPAALAFLDEYQFQTMYAPLSLGTKLYDLSFVAPLGPRWGAVGVSDFLLRSDGFQGRDDLNLVSGGGGMFLKMPCHSPMGRLFRIFGRRALGCGSFNKKCCRTREALWPWISPATRDLGTG